MVDPKAPSHTNMAMSFDAKAEPKAKIDPKATPPKADVKPKVELTPEQKKIIEDMKKKVQLAQQERIKTQK